MWDPQTNWMSDKHKSAIKKSSTLICCVPTPAKKHHNYEMNVCLGVKYLQGHYIIGAVTLPS